MATTRLFPMHRENRTAKQALKSMIEYIMNRKKTNDGELITTYKYNDIRNTKYVPKL